MFFRKLIKYYINPGYILGVGVFCGNSNAKKKHRKLIIQSHPSLPRWQAVLIYTLLSILWYLATFWLHLALFLSKKINTKYLKSNNSNALKATKDLLYSGLWLGVSPYNFIALELANTPRYEWKNYIFLEETNTWHTHLNRNSSNENEFQQDLRILTSKYQFSEHLLKRNFPAIETIDFLNKGSKLSIETIHSLCSTSSGIFIKPNSLNAMRGCFEVTIKKNDTDRTICIWGKTLQGYFIEKQVTEESLAFIQETLDSTDILIQPLLKNHQLLVVNLPNKSQEKLVTIRVITKLELPNRKANVILAIMEYQTETKYIQTWEMKSIDVDSGIIKDSDSFIIPNWSEIKAYVMLAHLELESIKTIAWDVCVCEDGVKLIEGNFGWNAIEIQQLAGKAILTII